MQVPETPQSVAELDLMKRLDQYASGDASWLTDGGDVGEGARLACRTLHTNLSNLINGGLAYVLDRVTAREMETFTMHDRVHGRKVAHLMWHILKEDRRERLTPPEIGILVVAAHLHDLGMGLSPSERASRLAPESDLWERLEIQESIKLAIENLRQRMGDPATPEPARRRATQELFQAEEALLTQDTRERHATRERYEEILGLLSEFHHKNPTQLPDVEAALSFGGDSFREKLIDVCVSHNEDADALVGNDEKNINRPRFPTDFPVGYAEADLHTVAATLRLADILDFDRERTPAVLFHYLLPETLGGLKNRSVLEWSKHLAVSNWHIGDDAVVFRGRSQSHVIHHAVVQFCSVIADEIKATHATFSALSEQYWPFVLPMSVKAEIHEEGYRYVPYKFELDDERVYSLLMGGAIYDNPLVAVRELVQNAVDACKLRDSLTCLHEEYEAPSKVNRIFIRYEEPTPDCPQPKLIVRDTGTGMDAYTLERYFLQVGRSYYNSSDFNQHRVQLRKKQLDFAPISEFGIGFLSCFLLADHVEVETAMWESLRGDTAKRTLKIDGPTRLIRLDEHRNDGVNRFKGTRITLFLAPKISRGDDKVTPATWEETKKYIREVCQDLPYSLNLEHVSDGQETKERIDSLPLTVTIPTRWESAALRIPVSDSEFGLEGEIVLMNKYVITGLEKSYAGEGTTLIMRQTEEDESMLEEPRVFDNTLLRGGFRVGDVPLLPNQHDGAYSSRARIRLTWATRTSRRYATPNLARNNMSDDKRVGQRVFREWLTYLIRHVDKLPEGQIWRLGSYVSLSDHSWLEEYDAYTIYRLGRDGWLAQLRRDGVDEKALEVWEAGQGGALPLVSSGLSRQLIERIMPKVTRLQVQRDYLEYLLPPSSGWQATLKNWHTYISSPVSWGNFADYGEGLGGLISYIPYGAPQRLNSKYEDRFTSWGSQEVEEVRRLAVILTNQLRATRRTGITPTQAALFRRFLEAAGGLKIGDLEGTWVLRDITLAQE